MPKSKPNKSDDNRYSRIIERIFFEHYRAGKAKFEFPRTEIETFASELGIELPKNLGDLIYSFRYRTPLPSRVVGTAPPGKCWLIRAGGKGRYRFELAAEFHLTPNVQLAQIKVPDATPGIIEKYRLSDEQALLAMLRYNRLVDIFTGLTCYSLQNHLRTTVTGLGQVETDEIYIGIDTHGAHYILPVQAKGGKDRQNQVQIEQDFALAAEHFPNLICRPIAAQFMDEGVIALFELVREDGRLAQRAESHYRLVPPDDLSDEELQCYRQGK